MVEKMFRTNSHIFFKKLYIIFFSAVIFISWFSGDVSANGNLEVRSLNIDEDLVELLISVDPEQSEINEGVIEIEFTKGLQFEGFVASEGVDIEVAELEDKISLKYQMASKDLNNIGIVTFKRVDALEQFILVSDVSDESLLISTYYKVPAIEGTVDVLSGIDIKEFLAWIAITIALAIAILVYMIVTSYQENTKAQQYVLFGMVGVIISAVAIALLPFVLRSPLNNENVLGLQIIDHEEVKVEEVEELFYQDGVCELNDYSIFLDDYLLFKRSDSSEGRSDLSGNGTIDNYDLKLFMDCMKYGR